MHTGHLFYGRHFSLLLCTVAVLAAVGRWRQPHEAVFVFGAYGALHSLLVAGTLRARRTLPRKLLFVVLAASLSMVSSMLALHGRHYVNGFPGTSGLRWWVTLSAGLGATSYAVLVRYFWIGDLSIRSMVSITLGCMLATFGVMLLGSFAIAAGGLGLAAGWWLAFSAGLWYHDGWRSAMRDPGR